MSKIISFDLKKQKEGIDSVVDLMQITIGPRGKNVSLSNGDTVNDGRRIAEDVFFKDPEKNKGATKVRNLVRKISQDVGGGRTASAILYRNLITVGQNLLDRGFNFNEVKKGMQLAVKDIHKGLDKMSQPVKGRLKEIATISTESEELGDIIANVMEKVGVESVVTVEQSPVPGIKTEIEEGLKFDKGWLSPYMVTDRERLETEYKDIPVFMTTRKISFGKDLIPILTSTTEAGKDSVLILCEDMDGEALNLCNFNVAQGKLKILVIKLPGIGDNKKFCTEDLAALTGATVIQDTDWDNHLENKTLRNPMTNQPIEIKIFKKSLFGKAKKIIAKRDSSVLIGSANLKTWLTTLHTRREMTENKWEIDQYNERIAKLTNGIAVIKVGSTSEEEIKYLKLKIEDGVNETKRALEEGIVMGGNCAFIHATKDLTSKDTGYNIVLKAIEAPLRQIVTNGQGSADVVIHQLKETNTLTSGYDSLEDKVVEDMYKEGIIDATKVVKTVLEYAVNEAILFLSLGGDVSEVLKED